jgi:8-oxo-dGTP pyrophosphatase MutT (NUDIX family)
MWQKYKVFSDKSLIHINESAKNNIPIRDVDRVKSFKHFEELTIKGQIQFVSSDPEKIFKNLFQDFDEITAAGGLVINSARILLIKRFGFWDLPKGKLEKGEEPSSCALREVQEECGLSNELKIVKEMSPSYHVYEHENNSILKKTIWFQMASSFSEKLIPQLEEDIVECRWVPIGEIDNYLGSTYPLIGALLNDFIGDK